MADIFISYSREDRDTARLVADALAAEGLSVWWDAALRAGEAYDEVTEANLRNAGAVVVLWSKHSSTSKWVRAEATVGERASTLVPALIEECERPIRFELVQTADLRHWRGDRADTAWRAFMQDIRIALARKAPAARPAPAVSHDASIETTFWNTIKDGRSRADFEAYLKRFPNGHFASLAQNRLAALGSAPAPAPSQQSARPTQSQSNSQPQSRQSPKNPPQAKAAKSGGSGMLIAGIVLGLAVIAGVGFMMLRDEKPIAATVETKPDAAVETTAVAEAAPELERALQPELEPAAEITTTEASAETPVEAPAAPVVEAPAETAPPADEPTFRDCENCPLMARLPGGAYMMGSPSGEPGRNAYEGPQHEVTLPPFAIGVYEVTNAEWAACVSDGACPARRGDDTGKLPALGLSWRDANAYAAWLSKKTGHHYRLPTESEWEYAARGGASEAYWWGGAFDRARVSSSPSAVGSFAPNAFGLYDVIGNAREWVEDCYVNNFAKAPSDGSAVSEGDCGRRVVRGGAWSSPPSDMRLANRSRIDQGVTVSYMGVRIARDLDR